MISVDILVIGAGASGLMFASLHQSKNLLVVDANEKIAKKIRVSGGGKCNLTNKLVSFKNYLGDEEFIKDILSEFSNKDVLKYFNKIDLVIRKKNQYFCKNSSMDIIRFFEKKVKNILLKCRVENVTFCDNSFYVKSSKGLIKANKLVVASGGVSFKELGSSDIAFEIAKSFGHKIVTLKPALVGFTLQRADFWMKNLSGISLKIKLKVGKKEFFDDLLFTHKGISGPVILNSSLYWQKGSLEIDFLPDIDFKLRYKQKQISSNFAFPKRFIKEFLKSIDLEDKVIKELNSEEIEKLKRLKAYKLAPAGDFGYSKAEVTKGGIDTDEIDANSMQSKLQKNLFFIGECLNVTGELGGYNFQWAFSSAYRVKL